MVWKVIAADVHLMLFILHTAWQIRVVNVSVVILITEAQFVQYEMIKAATICR